MSARLALTGLVLSGAAGLVYEVCWIRQASIAFGSAALAVSTIVSVFFIGLAAGSQVFGGVAARLERPLRTYAVLEAAIAILALLSLPAFENQMPQFPMIHDVECSLSASWTVLMLASGSTHRDLASRAKMFVVMGTERLVCSQFIQDTTQ